MSEISAKLKEIEIPLEDTLFKEAEQHWKEGKHEKAAQTIQEIIQEGRADRNLLALAHYMIGAREFEKYSKDNDPETINRAVRSFKRSLEYLESGEARHMLRFSGTAVISENLAKEYS